MLDAHRAERAGREDIDDMPMHRRLARLVHQHVEAVAGAPQKRLDLGQLRSGHDAQRGILAHPRGGTRCNTASGVAISNGRSSPPASRRSTDMRRPMMSRDGPAGS